MSFDSFDQYWLAYLAAHSRPATRACHYVGTVLGLFVSVLVAATFAWWAGLALAVSGYGLALASHPLVEGNRPFAHRPIWGLMSDLRMLGLASTGGRGAHLRRALTP